MQLNCIAMYTHEEVVVFSVHKGIHVTSRWVWVGSGAWGQGKEVLWWRSTKILRCEGWGTLFYILR